MLATTNQDPGKQQQRSRQKMLQQRQQDQQQAPAVAAAAASPALRQDNPRDPTKPLDTSRNRDQDTLDAAACLEQQQAAAARPGRPDWSNWVQGWPTGFW
jgi:hypothetical protein